MFRPQNTVNVLLDNVIFPDFLFELAIVGVKGFFLRLEGFILRLQRGEDVYKRQTLDLSQMSFPLFFPLCYIVPSVFTDLPPKLEYQGMHLRYRLLHWQY